MKCVLKGTEGVGLVENYLEEAWRRGARHLTEPAAASWLGALGVRLMDPEEVEASQFWEAVRKERRRIEEEIRLRLNRAERCDDRRSALVLLEDLRKVLR